MGKSSNTRMTPAYWKKNIAVNATKRILKSADSKKRTELDRFAIGQVVSYCSIIAVNDLFNAGQNGVERLTVKMNAAADKYIVQRRQHGQMFARNALAERTDCFFAEPFVLPAGKMPKKDKERRRLAERRDAADMVMRYYVEALHELGYSMDQIASAVRETRKNYSQFLEWAEDGEDVAYEKLRRVIEQTVGGCIFVEEVEGEPPVFGEAF